MRVKIIKSLFAKLSSTDFEVKIIFYVNVFIFYVKVQCFYLQFLYIIYLTNNNI